MDETEYKAKNEATIGGEMLILTRGRRHEVHDSEGGGAVEVYPDVHLTEMPAGGIWSLTTPGQSSATELVSP